MIKICVGYDPREAAAYHVFCESVISQASQPVQFIPLHRGLLENFDGQQDGSNAFIYSRYLIPYLMDFNGWAIFVDGDMVMNGDIAELWAYQSQISYNTAVAVVKHDYQTKHRRKYVGTPLESINMNYPKKNWSSVMLWNCGHYGNRILTPEYVGSAGGEVLHRFQWLKDEQIKSLPMEWNHLVAEYDDKDAKLYHFTIGVPGFSGMMNCDQAKLWNKHLLAMNNIAGERPVEMLGRASANHI